MNQVSSVRLLGAAFWRNALRQPIFAALLLISPMLGLIIRPMPALAARYLPAFDIQRWIPLFLAVVAGFPAYLFGLLAALMLLDERDRDLLPALQVSPVSDRGLFLAKIVPAFLLSTAGTPIALLLTGQSGAITPTGIIAATLIAGPSVVFYTVTASALAGTKVQGITIGKLMGTVLPAPVLLALLPGPWRWAALIFPSSWMGGVFLDPINQWFWAAGGLIYSSALVLMVWKFGMRRYFRKGAAAQV